MTSNYSTGPPSATSGLSPIHKVNPNLNLKWRDVVPPDLRSPCVTLNYPAACFPRIDFASAVTALGLSSRDVVTENNPRPHRRPWPLSLVVRHLPPFQILEYALQNLEYPLQMLDYPLQNLEYPLQILFHPSAVTRFVGQTGLGCPLRQPIPGRNHRKLVDSIRTAVQTQH